MQGPEMRRRTEAMARFPVAAVLVGVTLVATVLPVADRLLAQVYPTPPPPGSNILDPDDLAGSYAEALTDADLTTEIASPFGDILVENEPATFRATVTLVATGTPSVDPIQVAFENRATLIADCNPECDFDISPETPIQQQLRDLELTWEWDVVPRQSGRLTLVLEIQPVLVVPGSPATEIGRINRPIEIEVKVHPNRTAFTRVLAAADDLAVDLPDDVTVDRAGEVIATLPLPPENEAVDIDLRLDTTDNSVGVSILARPPVRSADTLRRTWTLEPVDSGTVQLEFAVAASAAAGDEPLMDQRVVQRTLSAGEPPPSLWDRIQTPVTYLTPFVVLLGGVLGIRSQLAKRRSAAAAGSGGGGPAGGAGEPDGPADDAPGGGVGE